MTENGGTLAVGAAQGPVKATLAKKLCSSGQGFSFVFPASQAEFDKGRVGRVGERGLSAPPPPSPPLSLGLCSISQKVGCSPSLSNIKQLNRRDLEPDSETLEDYQREASKTKRGMAVWREDLGGWFDNPRTSADLKRAFRLVENLKDMGREYGTEKLGFLTLTFVENMQDPKEAQRRFNSLMTNILRDLFPDYVVVLEPQKRGAIHYHLVVYCAADIRSGFDFEAVNSGDYKSANCYLRDLWKTLRESMPKYGFGRSELLPIKTNDEGIAKYVGKYLDKGLAFKGPQFKGMRTVRYRQRPRIVGPRFSWVVQGAQWRDYVSTFAKLAGVSDSDGMRARYGKHWAFWVRLALKSQDGEEVSHTELFRRFEFYASCSREHREAYSSSPPPPPLSPAPAAAPLPPRPFPQLDFLDTSDDLENLLSPDSFRWVLDIANPF